MNGLGWFCWLAPAISLKNAVSRAQTSVESQNICVWGVVLGEPWGMEKPMLRPEPIEIPFFFAVDDLKICVTWFYWCDLAFDQ